MELSAYFRSVLEQDLCAVVLCDLEHTILYMNPAAKKRYARRGGVGLVGKNLLSCHKPASRAMIQKAVAWFQESPANNRIYTSHNQKENKDVYIIALRSEEDALIGYYEKHEYRTPETAPPFAFDD